MNLDPERSVEIFNYIFHIHFSLQLLKLNSSTSFTHQYYMHKFLEIIECYTQELFVQIIPFKNIVESLINWLTHALNSILGVQWYSVFVEKELCDQKIFFYIRISRPVFSNIMALSYRNKNYLYKEMETLLTMSQTLSLIHPRNTIFHFHSFY